MTLEQEAHLERIIELFKYRVSAKYLKGQGEHGGNLFEKANLPFLLEEVLDHVVYAFTLEEQINEAILLLQESDETDLAARAALNLLVFGNKEGKKLLEE